MSHAKAKLLVLRAETTTYPRCEPSGSPMPEEWREVLEAYRRENAEPRHRVMAGRLISPRQAEKLVALDLDCWFDVYFAGDDQ